ncbi:MAG: Ig-like domain-containing protein [Acidobacteriota bacterium]
MKVSRAGFLKEDLHGRLGKILEDPIVLRLQPRICVTVLDAATEEPVTDYHLSVDQNRRYSTPGMSTIGVVEGPAKSIHSTDGRGCLSAPWEGPFLVTVTAQGYAQEKRRVGRRQDLPVLLGPEARLTVHVQDSEGEPSGGVHVLIGEPGAVNRHTWQPIYQAVADEQGTAQFIGVAPETWDLVLTTSESGIEAKRQIDLDPGDNEVTVTLDPCVDVQVTVLDQEGTPVPQVEVDLSPQSASLRTPGTCTTSALGRCVLQRMVMGKMPPTPCSQTRPSEKRSGSRRANRCRRSHSRSLKAMI